jgi:dethiobiotin synthetase
VPAYFVTGTDTGVGKTLVSCALLAAARRRGLSCAVLKPAETGCSRSLDGQLLAEDAAKLAEAAGLESTGKESCVYRFETPAAPAVAARLENQQISLAAIEDNVESLKANDPDLLLVEGAGGLLVPFTDEHAAADVARALDLPLLIVARPGLGTINHCALTVECARRRGLSIRGIILSHTAPLDADPTMATNAAEIERVADAKVLGSFPHLLARDLPSLAEAAERHLPLDALFGLTSTATRPAGYR